MYNFEQKYTMYMQKAIKKYNSSNSTSVKDDGDYAYYTSYKYFTDMLDKGYDIQKVGDAILNLVDNIASVDLKIDRTVTYAAFIIALFSMSFGVSSLLIIQNYYVSLVFLGIVTYINYIMFKTVNGDSLQNSYMYKFVKYFIDR